MQKPIAFVARQMAAIALVAAWVTTAHAEPLPYFGGPDNSKLSLNLALAERNEFLSTLVQSGVENLESLGGQINPTLTFGATGITATAGFSNGVNTAFQYSVSGVNFLWDTEGANDWIEFSEPITAFGSYIVQGGDGESAPPPEGAGTPTNTLTFRLENTFTETSIDVVIHDLGPDWPFYNVIFVGVTDTSPFNRVSFIESYDHDGLLWDDLVAGFVATTRLGDFDSDGDVDGRDFLAWQRGESPTPQSVSDLADWQANYSAITLMTSSAIPEPSGLAVALVAALFVGMKRHA